MLTLVLDSATPAVTAALVSIGEAPSPGVTAGVARPNAAGATAAGGGGAADAAGASGTGDGGIAAAGAIAGVEVLAESVTVDGRGHGELLTPAVAEVLARVGAGPRDLRAIVAGVGPGPFTGLRVGLVTAAAFADSLGIPAYGVCSLDAIGWAAGPGRVLVATDARRKEVYWAVYQDGVPLTGPAVGRPAELPLPDGVTAAIGDGALRYADQLGLPAREEPRYPPAAALAALAAGLVRSGAPGTPLTPLYLRRPDAVLPGARKSALP